MPTEIERKFLVTSDAWQAAASHATRYRQGYMPTDASCSVRVRTAGDRAYLNIKSGTLDVSRLEYEYPIPLDEAEELLERLCAKPLIEKTRHFVPVGDHTWEVDVFEGDNAGLVVAEVELGAVDEAFERPSWIGTEVSLERRYYNVCLVAHPFSAWSEAERAGLS